MKTLLMTLAAAGAASGVAAPAMAQYGYHDDSAHHRYAPASYNTGYGSGFNTGYGASYGYAARPYANSTYATGTYGAGGHYDYDPSPVHGAGYGMSRPATTYTPSYNAGYGTYGGYGASHRHSAPAYRPASSWGHSDSAHHGYGW